MIAWLVLTGCMLGSAPAVPDGVPEGAAHFWVQNGQLVLDGVKVAPMSSVGEDPLEEIDASLVETFAQGEGALWLELPPDTSFHLVRRMVNSARRAQREPLVVSASGDSVVHPLVAPPRYGLAGSCPDGAYPVLGVRPLITVSIQTGRDGAWLLGSARFLPVVQRHGETGPVDGLPPQCLHSPACEDAFGADAAALEACREGEASPTSAPKRVGLGGPTGCVAPIASEPSEVAGWHAEVAELVKTLRLGEQPLVMVMPEARVRLDALLALLTGFEMAGAGTPAIGTTLLIEGNDGPPLCQATVRSAADLVGAGARWLGSRRADPAPGTLEP